MYNRILFSFFAFAFLILLQSCRESPLEIYQWRGQDRSGIYPDNGLLKKWPADGPLELWSIDSLGRGYGSPTFVEDRFFITGEIDSMSHMYCFNLEGEQIWETTLGPEWVTSFPGSRSAPTIAGDRIYIGTGMGDLYCLDREDGGIYWTRRFKEDFQGQFPLHGHSEAALVWKDRVFWTPGGKAYNVVALDRFTGEVIWSQQAFQEYSGYNPGQLISHGGKAIFVTFSAYHLLGLDAGTGALLWSHEQTSYAPADRKLGYGDTHANSVIYHEGGLYYAAGDGNGGVRLDLSADATAISEVWRNPRFDSFMGGMVRIGNHLFTSGTSRPHLVAIDAASGKLIDSLRIGQGALISADSMLYYYTQRGEMKLLAQEEGKLREISSFRITKGTGQHFSHPVIHRGVLYQRRGNALMAYQIKEE